MRFPLHFGCVLFMGLAAGFIAAGLQAQDLLSPLPVGIYNENSQILLVPEAERHLNFIVLGLRPKGGGYLSLPDNRWPAQATPEQIRKIREQVYFLNFKLSRGGILKALPAYTHLFVAVPDPHEVPEAEALRTRVHFFKSSVNLEWPQDTCEILGRDPQKRIVLAVSSGGEAGYLQTIQSLVKAFPDTFVIHNFGPCLSSEGGDLELVLTPDRRPLLLVGRHRLANYLECTLGPDFKSTKQMLPYDLIEDARRAFSDAAYGVGVRFLPRRLILDPSQGSDEVFHLDMLVSVLPNPGGGKPRAFVPTYTSAPRHYDALTTDQLTTALVHQAQNEYEAAAEEMAQLGYEVVRLPFSDHPVRGPVNIAKFRNRDTGEYTVLLGKYPYHLPEDDPAAPQHQLQHALDRLMDDFEAWRKLPDHAAYQRLLAALDRTWASIEAVDGMPNPIFESQARLFRQYGYQVVPVPLYAWGAGGLHCQLLY